MAAQGPAVSLPATRLWRSHALIQGHLEPRPTWACAG